MSDQCDRATITQKYNEFMGFVERARLTPEQRQTLGTTMWAYPGDVMTYLEELRAVEAVASMDQITKDFESGSIANYCHIVVFVSREFVPLRHIVPAWQELVNACGGGPNMFPVVAKELCPDEFRFPEF